MDSTASQLRGRRASDRGLARRGSGGACMIMGCLEVRGRGEKTRRSLLKAIQIACLGTGLGKSGRCVTGERGTISGRLTWLFSSNGHLLGVHVTSPIRVF